MPALNKFRGFIDSFNAPARRHVAITPSDADELAYTVRRIYVGTGGDIALVDGEGNQVTYKNVTSGSYIGDCVYKQVKVTGTTATDLVGIE